MAKKLLRRDILLILITVAVILMTSVVVVAIQSRSFVKAPATGKTAITKKGEVVCMPHKNTDGPQTLECAYGIKDEGGDYYGLRYDNENSRFSEVQIGQKITVKGLLETHNDSVYATMGTIRVAQIEK